MKKGSTILAVVTVAALVLAPSSSLAAAGETSADCNLTFTERFSPGFTLTPSSGFQDSSVDSAAVRCQGTVNGHRLTGNGTFWNTGRYHNSTCLIDRATGSYFLTVETEDGPLTLDGSFTVERLGTLLKVSTRAGGLDGEGIALVVPIKGDCVLAPVTEALVLMSIHLEESESAQAAMCDLDAAILRINCRTAG